LIFNDVSPAIKLPDQTPVSGSGTATKQAKVRYLLKDEFFVSIEIAFLNILL
jgi:hypothetical protein